MSRVAIVCPHTASHLQLQIIRERLFHAQARNEDAQLHGRTHRTIGVRSLMQRRGTIKLPGGQNKNETKNSQKKNGQEKYTNPLAMALDLEIIHTCK